MGNCLYACSEFHENYIRHNRPVQIALAVVFGIVFIVVILAIGGAFKSNCTTCTSCFYYAFALNSLQTVCKVEATDKKKCIDNPTNNLTIHGLWPNLAEKNTISLANCLDNKNPYNPSELPQADMKARWPSAFQNNDALFWEHEWTTHGTCSPYKPKDYFEATLKLDKSYPVNKWLADAKIVPSNTKAYTVDEFKKALNKQIYESQYILNCKQVTINSKQVLWLSEVVLCAAYNGASSLVQCPFKNDTCVGNFYYVADYKTFTL